MERDEIYRLSRTFDEMLEELEEAFKREQQFTSDVSHELRTPVTVILAQCESVLQDPETGPKQKAQVEIIEKKARAMARMISQLLLLSRADQGRQQVQKERLNLSELTQMAAEEQEILAEEKGIRIFTEIQPDIYALADESLYIRMLDNLISNAVSYGKKGGYVKIFLCEGKRHGKRRCGRRRHRDPRKEPGKALGAFLPGGYLQDRTGTLRSGTVYGEVDRPGPWGRDHCGKPGRERKPVCFPDSKGLMLPYLTNYKSLTIIYLTRQPEDRGHLSVPAN